MPNVTLSIQENLLKVGREYAHKHHISLNALIRDLLSKTVTKKASSSWLDGCFKLMDKSKVRLKNKKFHREDLYDV